MLQFLHLQLQLRSLHSREAHQTGADTETGTRARRRAHRRRVDVQDGERGRRNQRDHGHLTELERLAGQHKRRHRDRQTLQQVLY